MNPNITKLRSRCEPPRCDFDGLQNSIRVLSRCRRRPYLQPHRQHHKHPPRIVLVLDTSTVRRTASNARPRSRGLEPLVQHLGRTLRVGAGSAAECSTRPPPSPQRSATSLLRYHSVLRPSVQKAPQMPPIHARRSLRCPGLSPSHLRTPSALPTVTAALGERRAPAGIRTSIRESPARTPAPTPSAPHVAGFCRSVGMPIGRVLLVPGFSRCTRRTAGARCPD